MAKMVKIGDGIGIARSNRLLIDLLKLRDGVDAALPLTASRCAILVVSKHNLKERASMEEVTIIGVDLAKNVFQLHGAAADGFESLICPLNINDLRWRRLSFRPIPSAT
ncbi:hypothetical protein [Roseovarius sp. 217]|uniref:hypothetical protein n=1 Tax=Roseovarius sp. (strain 217) TaxID=314264 RepID=UPI0000685AAC|nr:hypothetical protein [Roseovarius sp. 217]EAQ26823.1 hypothetical protein ROS217_19892 [Roseovarius sp. 217]